MKIPRWREGGYWTIPDEFRSRSRLLDFLKKHLEPVSFVAVATGNQNIAHNTDTTVGFDTSMFNVGSAYDIITDTFTAPYAGKYFFHANITWYNLAATFDQSFLKFAKTSGGSTTTYIVDHWNMAPAADGDPSTGGHQAWVLNGAFTQQGSVILDLAKNDSVVVKCKYVDTTSVTPEQLYGIKPESGGLYTQFLGYKL